MLFQRAVDKAIDHWNSYVLGPYNQDHYLSTRVSSVLRLDFTQGETMEGVLFSCPVTAVASLDDFVALGLNAILFELGYEYNREDLGDVIERLRELRFDSPASPERKGLLEHVVPGYSLHDLGRYDEPDVQRVAEFGSWIFPASHGVVLTSARHCFLYFLHSTG